MPMGRLDDGIGHRDGCSDLMSQAPPDQHVPLPKESHHARPRSLPRYGLLTRAPKPDPG